MTITISNLTVPDNAPTGTVVGTLVAMDAKGTVVPCNFIMTKKSAGYFAISGNELITVWSGSIPPGYYPVHVRANGINRKFGASASFVITVTAVDPLPVITFTPATASLPDNSVSGTTVASFSVAMSDGSTFSGTLAASPADMVTISANTRLVLARGLTSADNGSHQCS